MLNSPHVLKVAIDPVSLRDKNREFPVIFSRHLRIKSLPSLLAYDSDHLIEGPFR
jgi:hypothetical protein